MVQNQNRSQVLHSNIKTYKYINKIMHKYKIKFNEIIPVNKENTSFIRRLFCMIKQTRTATSC